MKKINLEIVASDYKLITEPAGKRVVASELRVGQAYLYYLNYKYRRVVKLTKTTVTYESDTGGWKNEMWSPTFCDAVST